jgi:CRISPR-associated protein Cmr1
MSWTTIHLQVTTPLFNDSTSGNAGVWVPSLRGAMRFWFRALAGGGIGPNVDHLSVVEKRVFGSTELPSSVMMRVPRQPSVARDRTPEWCDNSTGQGKWVSYLMGQGLSTLRKNEITRRYDCLVDRPYVAAGQEFDLKLRFAGPDGEVSASLVLASLWLLCTYGGLGARPRRGFGGLRIVSSDGWLPEPWSAESIRSPGLSYYAGRRVLWPGDDVIGRCMRAVAGLAKACQVPFSPVAWSGRLPTYPVLSKTHTQASLTPTTVGSWPNAVKVRTLGRPEGVSAAPHGG